MARRYSLRWSPVAQADLDSILEYLVEQDSLEAPGVIVINEAMAKRYWPNEDPIGRRIKIGLFNGDAPWLTIVGVTQDVKQGGLDRQPGRSVDPAHARAIARDRRPRDTHAPDRIQRGA